jgi:tetratricopeptide (TPR) repeat protein
MAQDILQAALELHRNGRLPEAEALYRRILSATPRHFDALHMLGVLALQSNRSADAVELIGKAIRANGNIAAAHFNLGNALRAEKRFEDAAKAFARAIALRPDHAESHNNRALALEECGRFEDAVAGFGKAITLRPDWAEAHYNRGNALRKLAVASRSEPRRVMELSERALADYDRAIELAPALVAAHLNRGNVLQELQRDDEAIASYDRAIELAPDVASSHNNRGNALMHIGRDGEAEQSFRKAIELDPDDSAGFYNLSLLLLQRGDFAEGLKFYERRHMFARSQGRRDYSQPQWVDPQRDAISGKTLFVYWEQGFGDTIQFCRFLRPAAELGATVIFEAQKPLRRLLSSFDDAIRIVGEEDRPTDFDYHCPLMSLPMVLGATAATIPSAVPYLRPESEIRQRWAERIGSDGFRIGIAWQGATANGDLFRSFALREMEVLSRIPGVRLISLQKGFGTEQLQDLPDGMKVETLGDDFDSGPDAFIDTAAVMDHLDLVISCDTSIVHLAGALGRPAWIALKKVPEWRWMVAEGTTPWYPTLRLFRQRAAGDWAGVFTDMANALRETLQDR